jgi:hypothetical protein
VPEFKSPGVVQVAYLHPISDSGSAESGCTSVFIQLPSSVTFSILLRHWMRSRGICKDNKSYYLQYSLQPVVKCHVSIVVKVKLSP